MNDKMSISKLAVIMLTVSIVATACVTASEESATIQAIQHEISDGSTGWVAGVTTVSGLTPSEKRRLSLPDPIPRPVGMIVAAPEMRSLQYEERFNWCDFGVVSPVKSQGSCGGCWAFAATGAMESVIAIRTGKDIDLSEQHLVSECCDAGGCGGGWPDKALQYAKDVGIPDEACYPYKARDGKCDPCSGWSDVAWMIDDFVYVNPNTDDFKWALKEYGPLAVVLSAPEDWYYYRSGTYTPTWDGGIGWANHAVVLVGWNDSDGCWIIKNSWGTGWGEDGFARVKYGNLEKYEYAYAVTGIVDHGENTGDGEWVTPIGAVGSSIYSDPYRSTMSIDGNRSTHWFSERYAVDPYVIYDLGELITVSSVRVMCYPSDIPIITDIAVSGNCVDWVTVANAFVIKTGGEYVEIPIEKSECRYVRMTQTETYRVYGTCTEFDVFSVADVVPYPDPTHTTITISYPDRDETINISEDVLSIMLLQNETKVWEWWASEQSVGGR